MPDFESICDATCQAILAAVDLVECCQLPEKQQAEAGHCRYIDIAVALRAADELFPPWERLFVALYPAPPPSVDDRWGNEASYHAQALSLAHHVSSLAVAGANSKGAHYYPAANDNWPYDNEEEEEAEARVTAFWATWVERNWPAVRSNLQQNVPAFNVQRLVVMVKDESARAERAYRQRALADEDPDREDHRDEHPQADPTDSTGDAQADAEPPDPNSRPATVNQRMLEKINRGEGLGWSCREWADHLGCSHSTVQATDAWKRLLVSREMSAKERAENDLKRSHCKRTDRHRKTGH